MDLITYAIVVAGLFVVWLMTMSLARIADALAKIVIALNTANAIADEAHPRCGHGNRQLGCPYEHPGQ